MKIGIFILLTCDIDDYSFRPVNKLRNNVKVINFHNHNGGIIRDIAVIYMRARVNESIVNICTSQLRLQCSIGN